MIKEPEVEISEDEYTFHMDTEALEASITEQIKASVELAVKEAQKQAVKIGMQKVVNDAVAYAESTPAMKQYRKESHDALVQYVNGLKYSFN